MKKSFVFRVPLAAFLCIFRIDHKIDQGNKQALLLFTDTAPARTSFYLLAYITMAILCEYYSSNRRIDKIESTQRVLLHVVYLICEISTVPIKTPVKSNNCHSRPLWPLRTSITIFASISKSSRHSTVSRGHSQARESPTTYTTTPRADQAHSASSVSTIGCL